MELNDKNARSTLGRQERNVALEEHLTQVLGALDLSTEDPNIVRTPERVAKWLTEYNEYVETDLSEILGVRFPTEHAELVIISKIAFDALCAHHMLPFRGTASIGYIPKDEVIGLSKIPRALRYYAKRITLQEDITQQLADGLMHYLNPLGVIAVLRAEHQCMSLRGIKDTNAVTTTSAVRGVFLTNDKNCKDEFLKLMEL